eukprot:gb/GECH01008428.1/.p1 GENE.gb/GECH01008428.1/~~gb/GECH01008428.1/.p1  ORF type:complete len:868 (+),score=204.37 gb/GECH01008428.1/:1-2604(+)
MIPSKENRHSTFHDRRARSDSSLPKMFSTCPLEVIARIRPPSEKDPQKVSMVKDEHMYVAKNFQQPDKYTAYKFGFDRVFDEYCSQDALYRQCMSPILQSVLHQGISSSVVVNGGTMSGKTYTLEGLMASEKRGIIPRFVEDLLTEIRSSSSGIKATVKASYFQLYRDHIQDLLGNNSDSLKVVEEPKHSYTYVQGLKTRTLRSAFDIFEVFKKAHIESSKINHSKAINIFCISLEEPHNKYQEKEWHSLGPYDGKAKQYKRISCVYFVEIPHAEIGKDMSPTKAEPDDVMLSKTTATLSAVLGSVGKGPQLHVPYRESKLTHILRDGLGPYSKCLVIGNFHSTVDRFQETLSIAKYLNRLKNSAFSAYRLAIVSTKTPLSVPDQSNFDEQDIFENSESASSSVTPQKITTDTVTSIDNSTILNQQSLDEMKVEYTNAVKEREGYKLQYKERMAEIRRLREENDNLRMELFEMKQKLDRKSEQYEHIHRLYLSQNSEATREKDLLESLRSDLKFNQDELEEMRKERDRLKGELHSMKNKYEDLQEWSNEIQTECTHWKEEVGKHINESRDIRDSSTENSRTAFRLNEENKELKQTVGSLRRDLSKAEKEKSRAEEELTTIRNINKNVTKENDDLHKEITNMEQNTNATGIPTMPSALTPAKSVRPGPNNNTTFFSPFKLADLDPQQQQEDQKDEPERDNNYYREEAEKLSSERDDLRKTLSELTGQVQQNRRSSNREDQLEQTLYNRENQLENQKSEIDQLSQQIENLKAQMTSQGPLSSVHKFAPSHNDRNTSLDLGQNHSELEKLKDENESLKTKLDLVEEQINAFSSKMVSRVSFHHSHRSDVNYSDNSDTEGDNPKEFWYQNN